MHNHGKPLHDKMIQIEGLNPRILDSFSLRNKGLESMNFWAKYAFIKRHFKILKAVNQKLGIWLL
jgi:hypothetical protein